MRKLLKGILLGLMIGCLAGCSNSGHVENKEMTLTFSYGERTGVYTGDIEDGVPEGIGSFESVNDSNVKWVYTGTWKQGVMDGEGTCEWEDGSKYEGGYKAGLRDGQGSWYENVVLSYSGVWDEGVLLSLDRKTIILPEDTRRQYVQLGDIGFQMPETWTYEIVENTAYINIPEVTNVGIVYSAQEPLDLDKEENREAIKQLYLTEYGAEYPEFMLVSDSYNSDEYNLHYTFYNGDIIADVYSNVVTKNSGTYVLTVTHLGISDDYSEAAQCIPNTMKNWESHLEDIAELESEQVIQNAMQYLDGDIDWEGLEKTVPKATAEEIINHNAPQEQIVRVEGIIDNISDETFDLWIPCGDTYYKDADWSYSIDLGDISNGMAVEVCIETYYDGSLKHSDGILAIRKLGIEVVEDILSVFKDSCPSMDYKAIMRNPDNAYGTICKASGKVFQVIETESYMQEFLLELNDGNMVYVSYFKEDNDDNVLEDDNVNVYGAFYMTETYTTLLGESKTVPRLSVDYVEIK